MVSSDVTPVYSHAEDALKMAKITLMMGANTVFYTTILFSLKQSFTEDIPTAGVDGKNLVINPDFFVKLKPVERLGLLAHEILHVALDHMHRIGNRDHQLWNIAGDYVINNALLNADYTLPEGALYSVDYDNKTTEQVYDILDKKSDKEKQSLTEKCNDGSLNGNDISYPTGDTVNDVTKDEVTSIVLRASVQAKAMNQTIGSVPDEVKIELDKVLNPKLPWYSILQNYLTDFTKDDYSFRKPNRRFLPEYYLPSAYSESIANIAIAVDTSASVTKSEFDSFINKIAEIQDAMRPKKITVVAFDTKIKNVQELTEDDNPLTTLKFFGRGGTRIEPVHKWIAQNKPTITLIFTDGEFRQTEPIDKTIPIIWLINNSPGWATEYGRVINYDLTN